MSDKKESSSIYEDYSDVIDLELAKRRNNWFLNSVSWIDFDDVSQIIRAHIHKKWDQWDQERPIKPWLNKIISNQFKNILRNNYSNYARPCLNCPFAMEGSESQCLFTPSGSQDSSCPLYKKWEKTKKQAYNVKITLSIENHLHEVDKTYTESDQDIEQSIKKLISELKKVLNKRQWQAFDLLFIRNLSDEDAAKEMGFKSSESGRKAGYKQIKNLKNILKEKAEKILSDKGIVFLNADTNETDRPPEK
jgi:DNA-directed RNA polymerase specialized sigma24 family protein